MAFMSGDTDAQGQFHGRLHSVSYIQGPNLYGGRSATTQKTFTFESTASPVQGSEVLLTNWEATAGDPAHLKPGRASTIHWILPELPRPVPVVEACSGLGFMGQGFTEAGFQRHLAIEHCAPVCDLLTRMGVTAYRTDVSEQYVPHNVLVHTNGHRFGLLAGFSCQPWSQFGDGQGLRDTRARSLYGVLRLAHYTKAEFLLLENVLQCWQDPEVTELLHRLCELRGWQAKLFRKELQRDWTTARARGWFFLGPRELSRPQWTCSQSMSCQRSYSGQRNRRRP